MRRFDPAAFVKSSVLDVAADQIGAIFDIPPHVVDASELDGRMRLRSWHWHQEDGWVSEDVLLSKSIRAKTHKRAFGISFRIAA
jgi:hypothetical protein